MAATFLTLLLGLTPPTGFTAAMERVPLVRQGATIGVEVQALRGLIRLRGLALAPQARSELCPRSETRGGALDLRCSTRLLWAEIFEEKRGPYLEVRRLRGAPWLWHTDGIPTFAWSLESIGLPDRCPGTISAARAECALAAGSIEEAKAAYQEALTSADVGLALVRLGDFALAAGRVEEALSAFSKVRQGGIIGRMARERECELIGTCPPEGGSEGPKKSPSFTLVGLSGGIRTEALLRHLRREALFGRLTAAVTELAKGLEDVEPLCFAALGFCQSIALAALESADEAARMQGLAAFTSPELRGGPYDLELAVEGARVAEQVGAPVFAARVLSVITDRVPKADLPAHLLRVAQLYLAGEDVIRAALIVEYAESRLGARTVSAPSWRSVRQRVSGNRGDQRPAAPQGLDTATLMDEVGLATELARAATLRSRVSAATRQEIAHE